MEQEVINQKGTAFRNKKYKSESRKSVEVKIGVRRLVNDVSVRLERCHNRSWE